MKNLRAVTLLSLTLTGIANAANTPRNQVEFVLELSYRRAIELNNQLSACGYRDAATQISHGAVDLLRATAGDGILSETLPMAGRSGEWTRSNAVNRQVPPKDCKLVIENAKEFLAYANGKSLSLAKGNSENSSTPLSVEQVIAASDAVAKAFWLSRKAGAACPKLSEKKNLMETLAGRVTTENIISGKNDPARENANNALIAAGGNGLGGSIPKDIQSLTCDQLRVQMDDHEGKLRRYLK